jgi:hypothetical protein
MKDPKAGTRFRAFKQRNRVPMTPTTKHLNTMKNHLENCKHCRILWKPTLDEIKEFEEWSDSHP